MTIQPGDRRALVRRSTSATGSATTSCPTTPRTCEEGAFYGWPWYYIGGNEDPRHQGERPDLEGQVTVPDVLFQAHSAPLGIAFYDGDQFPAEYKGDAFVALHGSWNRGTPHRLQGRARARCKDGRPTGEYEDFMTGFVIADARSGAGRSASRVAKDGSLLVTEDGNGTIWRISYRGDHREAAR